MGDGYRLGPVRDERARQQRMREGDLASAVGDAKSTQTKVDSATASEQRIHDAIARACTVRDALISDGATTHAVALAERHLGKLRRDHEAALDVLARATAEHAGQLAAIDAARHRLALARGEKEVIERHFARWRADRARLRERRED